MNRIRFTALSTFVLAVSTLPMACSDSGSATGVKSGWSGAMVVRLTDAPFLTDSVKEVDIFVVRVDARTSDADSAAADNNLTDASSATDGWKSVATPNASFDLLSLQNGVAATLGQADLPAGTYNGFRLIIDPTKSSVTLKSGLVLTGGSSPGVTFPSASRSGIKIVVSQPVSIVDGTTTTLLVDFNVNDSFVMRGNSIDKNGLLFKPVIKATITNTALTNAMVRLANATNGSLDLRQSATVLAGASNVAFGASSACSSISATAPLLTVTQTGSTTPLPGFAPTLAAGKSYSIIAFPTAANVVQFATLPNAFVPASGQAGLQVFNATTIVPGFDVFVTAPGGPLGTATVANVLAGIGATFISVPAGTSQIRLTAAGGSTVLLDVGSQSFTAGQNTTLVIAPPASGATAPRAFLVAGC